MEKLKYSFPISQQICKELVETSRPKAKSNGHSRYLNDYLKYFKNGMLVSQIHFKGSAKRYRLSLINNRAPARKIRSLATYRRAIHEFKNESIIGGEWQTAMSTAIAAFNASVKASKILGCVQHFEKDGHLQISCFSDKQLECLYKTPYDKRILHVDATGSLVKTPNFKLKFQCKKCIFFRKCRSIF